MTTINIFVPILTLITAIIGVVIISRYRKQDRFYALKETLLPLIEVLEYRKYPNCPEENKLLKEKFAEQDRAFLRFKVILSRKRRDILNKKWAEYKKKREPYKDHSMTAFMQFVGERAGQQENKELLNLIYEILKTT